MSERSRLREREGYRACDDEGTKPCPYGRIFTKRCAAISPIYVKPGRALRRSVRASLGPLERRRQPMFEFEFDAV